MSGSPSAQLVREAVAPHEAVAADGRRLTLRRMTVFDRLRLFKALGAELAANDAYLGIAYLAFAVSAIDDVPVPTPVNEAQLESIVGRLGDAGIEAVAEAFAKIDTERAVTPQGN